MDADELTPPFNPAQDAFDKTQAQLAANRARKIAENDALNRIQPGNKLNSFPKRP